MKDADAEAIENVIAHAKSSQQQLVIVSGEGTRGTVEVYTGKISIRAIKSRLTRERCGGDRWARLDTPDNYGLIVC